MSTCLYPGDVGKTKEIISKVFTEPDYAVDNI